MSKDYETKRTDLHASREDRDRDRPAVEDPLVELARIVHKNKQSGADVSRGRVGSTDYFAGLDDVAAQPRTSSEPSPRRTEPTFSGPRSTPEQERSDLETPAPEDTLSRGTYGEAALTQDEPSHPASEPQANIPASGGIAATGGANVSSLWPRQTEFTRQQAPEAPSLERSVEPETEAPATTPSDHGVTSLAPSVAMDLEQNLTAELEDELIGAIRQSVHETADDTGYVEANQEFSVRAEPREEQSDVFSSYPQTGHDEHGYGYEVVTHRPQDSEPAGEAEAASSDTAPSRSEYPAPPVEHGVWRASVGAVPQQARADQTGAPTAHGRQRPTIDENDFLAALNSGGPATGSDDAADIEDGNLDGIDSLFADLDFPDPANRKPVQASAQPTVRDEHVSTPEIDDMTWPAAAQSVPHTEEDETPPPPEGYDLDAVARAMQESDPSLSGAGVLPPHPAAERAAIPHAGQRSRRGVFVAAGVLGVAILGAGGFLLLDGGSVEVPSGPPPVISGLEDPLKVYPEKTAAAETDNQTAKLIYDRVVGSSGPERLVVPESPEPADLPPAPVEANGDADLVPGSPRQVRTLVVRPDGTIISGGEQPVPTTITTTDTSAAPLTAPASSTTEEAPRAVPTTPVVTENAPEEQISPEPETAPAASAEAPLEAPESTVASAPAIVTQQTAEDATAASEPPVSEPAAPIPSILPRKKPDAPVQIARAPEQTATPAASTQENGPLNLTESASAPAETAPANPASSAGSIPSGTHIVQVTSQRTSQAASDAYSGLQRRFPAILGNREAVIVSADLGDRGTFYRARIPTGSRDEAISLCESLKGAGGDCFVRRQP